MKMTMLCLKRWVLPIAVVSALGARSGGAVANERATNVASVPVQAPEKAATASVAVTLDYARVLRFDEPVRTIVIGNPGVVDGTIGDSNILVLTGKAVGTTNLIVLGEAGRQISNLVVSVAANERGHVTIYSGPQPQAYACVGPCRQVTPAAVIAPAPRS